MTAPVIRAGQVWTPRDKTSLDGKARMVRTAPKTGQTVRWENVDTGFRHWGNINGFRAWIRRHGATATEPAPQDARDAEGG